MTSTDAGELNTVIDAINAKHGQLAKRQGDAQEVNDEPSENPAKSIAPALAVQAKPNRLYAVIIGVDEYEAGYTSLEGAVEDASAVEAFLLDQKPAVAAGRIKRLTNEQATAAKIVETITSFWRHTCDDESSCVCAVKDVEKDDPILIYYAGHGSNLPKPNGWPTASSHIQCIAPYGVRVEGGLVKGVVSDRALGTLLIKLAEAKGNNITVILDCCHSGSGTRDNDSIPRGLEFKSYDPVRDEAIYHTIDSSYEEEVYRNDANHPNASNQTAGPRFADSDLQSHILLAACSPEQSAFENRSVRRGRFTSALLTLLRKPGTGTLTYAELIQRLDNLPQQTPQCEGYYKNSRVIFEAGLVQRIRDCYAVSKSGEPSYSVRAGLNDGVMVGDVFEVYRNDKALAMAAKPLAHMVVDSVNASASFVIPVGPQHLDKIPSGRQPTVVLRPKKRTPTGHPGKGAPLSKGYHLVKSMYILRAGRIHGVSEGDVFAVYESKAAYISASASSGRLVVAFAKAVTSSMAPVEDSTGALLRLLETTQHAVAILERAGTSHVFRCHVDSDAHPDLYKMVASALAKDALDPAGRLGCNIVFSALEESCIALVPAVDTTDTVDLIILDERIRALGIEKLSGRVVHKVDPIRAALRSAAHFFYHLDSSPDQQGFKNGVTWKMHIMHDEMIFYDDDKKRVPMPVYRPVMEVDDFSTSGVFSPTVSLPGDGNITAYGMDVSIVPESKYNFFVWLFYFDCSTLRIKQHYGPPIIKDDATPPLIAGSKEPLPLNYGDAGSLPFIFRLPNNIHREVGFLRLFVSTHYTDLSSIEQGPVVEPGRDSEQVVSHKASTQGWDAVTFAVVITDEKPQDADSESELDEQDVNEEPQG
ncbi:unnamed protein product [Peniophora sp. CBMAI 1063]|nr:unnamed protein product [Peniophora sp. CBMAI 1063]